MSMMVVPPVRIDALKNSFTFTPRGLWNSRNKDYYYCYYKYDYFMFLLQTGVRPNVLMALVVFSVAPLQLLAMMELTTDVRHTEIYIIVNSPKCRLPYLDYLVTHH